MKKVILVGLMAKLILGSPAFAETKTLQDLIPKEMVSGKRINPEYQVSEILNVQGGVPVLLSDFLYKDQFVRTVRVGMPGYSLDGSHRIQFPQYPTHYAFDENKDYNISESEVWIDEEMDGLNGNEKKREEKPKEGI